MHARITKLTAGLAAVSAFAFGGAALAGAANPAPPVTPPAATDTLQQGVQTAPDPAGAAAESSSESTAAESAASESASESAASESASESAASDGPGGHADDPANAGLDNQFQGEQ